MRYKEIIDYANENQAERLARLSVMYGVDEAEDHAQHAETELTRAKADKLRAEALAAVAKVEAEYEELAFENQKAALSARMPTGNLVRPK